MRFHMGVSFRLKHLKKFIIPILIGLLAYLFGSGLIAHADEVITIDTYNVEDLSICNKPVSDYINFFQDMIGNNFNMVVINNSYYDGIAFSFIPNEFDGIYANIFKDTDNNNHIYWRFGAYPFPDYNTLNSIFTLVYDPTKCNNVSFMDNVNAISDFYTYIETPQNFLNPGNKFNNFNSTEFYAQNYFGGISNNSTRSSYTYTTSSSNNLPYLFIDNVLQQSNTSYFYIIYSNVPSYYTRDDSWYRYPIDNQYPVIYNGSSLSEGQQINYNYYPQLTYDDYYKVNDIFIYDESSNLSNLSIDFNYNPVDPLYSTAIYPFVYEVYGQVYHTNINGDYITFDKLDSSSCNLSYSYSHTNGDKLHLGSFTCSNNIFSGYDYVSLKVNFVYENLNDREVNTSLYSYSVISNAISYFVNTDTYNFHYANIYYPLENDSNVSTSKKILLTTSDNFPKTSSAISTSKYTNFIYYTLDTQQIVNPIYNEVMWDKPYVNFNYGLSLNRGVILATDPSYDSTYNLKLFLSSNTYISLSDGSNFCYYSSNGLICESFVIQYDDSSIDDSYNVDSWFSIVTNFVDGMSTDMINFGSIIQDVYDTMPSFISSFFVVIFILGNAYILFKLIKR